MMFIFGDFHTPLSSRHIRVISIKIWKQLELIWWVKWSLPQDFGGWLIRRLSQAEEKGDF